MFNVLASAHEKFGVWTSLSSSKELACNLSIAWHKVLENTKQANNSSFSTYFMISVTDAKLLIHAEMHVNMS